MEISNFVSDTYQYRNECKLTSWKYDLYNDILDKIFRILYDEIMTIEDLNQKYTIESIIESIEKMVQYKPSTDNIEHILIMIDSIFYVRYMCFKKVYSKYCLKDSIVRSSRNSIMYIYNIYEHSTLYMSDQYLLNMIKNDSHNIESINKQELYYKIFHKIITILYKKPNYIEYNNDSLIINIKSEYINYIKRIRLYITSMKCFKSTIDYTEEILNMLDSSLYTYYMSKCHRIGFIPNIVSSKFSAHFLLNSLESIDEDLSQIYMIL